MTYENKLINVADYSLDVIKTTIKTIQATSPEREELKNDLQDIVDTIEVKPNKAIVCYSPIIGQSLMFS